MSAQVVGLKRSRGFLMYCTEVGQALLQRHEAYVRRHEASYCDLSSGLFMNARHMQTKCRIKQTNDIRQHANISDDEDDEDDTKVFQQEQFDVLYEELLKEKQGLEKASSCPRGLRLHSSHILVCLHA